MSVIYNSYFDKIPKIKYDINRSLTNPQYETVTNIFFRVKFMYEVLNNISAYFTVELDDSDTPEILAEKVYGDSGAGWMITMANEMTDPQWNWPMTSEQFNKYIIGKYGSIESSQTTYHHYNMVVTRTLEPDNITSERRYEIDGDKLTLNMLPVPYNYYYPNEFFGYLSVDSVRVTVDSTQYTVDAGLGLSGQYIPMPEYGIQSGSLAYTQFVNTYNMNGKTIHEVVKGEAVTNYDYEMQLNDSKRFIKIIKKDYYNKVMEEFKNLTNFSLPFQRRVF